MSQEQPPVRSRRELRQARDERQDDPGTGTAGPGAVPAAPNRNAGSEGQSASGRPAEPTEAETTGRRRIPGPVDSARTTSSAQRSSQIRARDRAALRTIKELAEKEGQLSPGGPLTRRQLRLQQLAEETAPATSANPIVPMPSSRNRPPAASAPEAAAAQPPAGPAAAASPKLPEGMSVEQALAARQLLAEQARNQVAKMEHIAATDPEAVNPEVLAEQIALAERAAVLNRRAAAKQKLAEQATQAVPRSEQPRTDKAGSEQTGTDKAGSEQTGEKPGNGPSTASNLAMVTPLEFVEIPGVERPVMKRPATSYVPLVTNPGPRVKPAKTSRRPGSSRQRDAGTVPGRAGVLARAEAAAQAARRPATPPSPANAEPAAATHAAAEEEYAARPPVAANSAYGLDPLDAATAGLARARRLQMLQLGVLVLGVLALIAGIILIITGMAR